MEVNNNDRNLTFNVHLTFNFQTGSYTPFDCSQFDNDRFVISTDLHFIAFLKSKKIPYHRVGLQSLSYNHCRQEPCQ